MYIFALYLVYNAFRVSLLEWGGRVINIAICDDEEKEVNNIYDIVSNKFASFKVVYKIIKCSNGADLLYEMDEIGAFDLVFLDIELGIDNGIETASKLKQKNPYCNIIFVSGYDRYYKAAFSVQPFQFLDKPVNPIELENVIDSVAGLIINNDLVFSFEYKWKQYRIPINTILYFISDRRVIELYTKDGQVYQFYGKMNEVETQMNEKSSAFLRIHKSYFLNMNYIKVFKSQEVVMQDDKVFQISVRKHKEVVEQYMRFYNNWGR